MPPPVSVDGIEQRQAVDGQVAVEVILGVETSGTRIKTVQTRPSPSTTQGQRGRRAGASGGWVLMGTGRGLRSIQTKKSETGQRNPGSSGRFSRLISERGLSER